MLKAPDSFWIPYILDPEDLGMTVYYILARWDRKWTVDSHSLPPKIEVWLAHQ